MASPHGTPRRVPQLLAMPTACQGELHDIPWWNPRPASLVHGNIYGKPHGNIRGKAHYDIHDNLHGKLHGKRHGKRYGKHHGNLHTYLAP